MNFVAKTSFKVTAIVATSALLSACSGISSVENKPDSAGIAKTFNAPKADTVAAAKSALNSYDLNLTSESNLENRSVLLFSKPFSLFSYGEIGRILFVSQDPASTKVNISTQKRLATNITAKSEKSFASDIFGFMQKILPR